MAPYAQNRMYQRGHGVGAVLANLAGRYAIPLLKKQGKKLLVKGLREGVGFLTDKISGKKVSAKGKAKALALQGLAKINKQISSSKAGKGGGRVKKSARNRKKKTKKYGRPGKKYNRGPVKKYRGHLFG